MALNNPTVLSHSAVMMLASVDSVDFGTADVTTLYTVPVGKKCTLDHIRIRVVSGDCKLTVVTVGQSAAVTDFLGSQTLSTLNAAGATGMCRPITHGTIVKGIEYTAGEIIQIDVATASGDGAGTPTATIELHGMLDDA